MSLTYTVRPISDRTAFTGKHQPSQFKVRWSDALDLLEREYRQLNGRHLVLEVDVEEWHIRNDGGLYANARAATPAVRVAFESKFGPIVMATDRFVRGAASFYVSGWSGRDRRESMQDWQHNVYAIAKSLEALRMVDRYGVTKRGEQYTGWKALPPGTGLAPTGMTVDLALKVLSEETGGNSAGTAEGLAVLLRNAKANAHPDRNNGDRSRWNAVDEAEQVLRRAGRLA